MSVLAFPVGIRISCPVHLIEIIVHRAHLLFANATGGLGQFNNRVKVLPGRQIIAFPDLGACDRWREKAKDYPLLDITVSDYLEKNSTPQQREIGADLADLVVEERMGGRGIEE